MKKLAPVLALGLALVWIAVRLLGQEPAPDSAALSAGAGAPDAAGLEKSMPRLPGADSGIDTDTPQADTKPEQAQRAAVDVATELEPKPMATLRGRFLFPDGTPAPGVTLKMGGWSRGSQATQEFGAPEDWPRPAGETDREGNFELQFEAPRAFQFTLDAKLPGYAKESWRWNELAPTEVVDVGTLRLRNTGTIEGFVIDLEGNPMKQRWRISARSVPTAAATLGRSRSNVTEYSNPETGAFRLEDVAAGAVELSASSQVASAIYSVTVDVLEGKTTSANLTYEGPNVSRRIVLVTSTSPFHSLAGEVTGIRISGQGVDQELQLEKGRSQSFAIEDLEDGLYTATIDDERFSPWIQEGIRPGEKVTARLKGSASAQLDVRDEASGTPVEEVQVLIDMGKRMGQQLPLVEIHELGPLPDGGLLPHIPSGERGLVVTAPGYAPFELSLGNLLPGEVRPVTALMLPESSLGGTASYTDGSPAPNIEVILMPPGAEPAALKTWSGGSNSYVGALHARVTDDKGKFHFAKLPPGTYDVYGINTPWLLGHALGQVLAQGEHREVGLEIPRGATLKVALSGLGDQVPEGFAVYAQTEAKPHYYPGPFHRQEEDLRQGQTKLKRVGPGRWIARDLTPGLAKITLGRSHYEIRNPGGWTSQAGGHLEPLGEVVLEDGRDTKFTSELAGREPGSISVSVYAQGEPSPNSSVLILTEAGTVAGAAETNTAGVAAITGIFPGSYTVKADLANGAHLIQDQPVVVSSNLTSATSLEFIGYTNTIRCFDPNGELMPGIGFTISSADMSVRLTARPNGEVEATLSPGEYTVRMSMYKIDMEEWAALEGHLVWPAADGETLEFTLGAK